MVEKWLVGLRKTDVQSEEGEFKYKAISTNEMLKQSRVIWVLGESLLSNS